MSTPRSLVDPAGNRGSSNKRMKKNAPKKGTKSMPMNAVSSVTTTTPTDRQTHRHAGRQGGAQSARTQSSGKKSVRYDRGFLQRLLCVCVCGFDIPFICIAHAAVDGLIKTSARLVGILVQFEFACQSVELCRSKLE
jgi:hypothetical protein